MGVDGRNDVRRLGFAIICGLFTAALAGGALAANGVPQDRIEASRAVARDFADRLKGALAKAIEQDGPIGAVEVCHTLAPQLAAEASARTGWRVGRTSLMTRNAANHPDAWEQDVLAKFAARKAAGASLANMESWAIVENNGQKQFRYMKAIPTASVCLTCHGNDIDPALRASIDALYPEDRATGYREGDLRGAFTISQPM